MVDGLIQNRGELRQASVTVVIDGIHFDRLSFAGLTTAFRPQLVRGEEAGVAMQPSAQQGLLSEPVGGVRAKSTKTIWATSSAR